MFCNFGTIYSLLCVLFTVVYNFTYMYTQLNDNYKHCTYYVCKSSGKFIIILSFSLDEVMSGAQEAEVEVLKFNQYYYREILSVNLHL